MILWAMLVLGIVGFVASIFSIKEFGKLNEQLDRDAKKVEYFDYLITGYSAILLPPASLFIIVGSVICLFA